MKHLTKFSLDELKEGKIFPFINDQEQMELYGGTVTLPGAAWIEKFVQLTGSFASTITSLFSSGTLSFSYGVGPSGPTGSIGYKPPGTPNYGYGGSSMWVFGADSIKFNDGTVIYGVDSMKIALGR